MELSLDDDMTQEIEKAVRDFLQLGYTIREVRSYIKFAHKRLISTHQVLQVRTKMEGDQNEGTH